MTANTGTCGHYSEGWGICGAPGARRYLPGLRCPMHTPAKLAGHPETVPDPARTLAGLRARAGADPDVSFTPAGETVVDARAKASGKRRSSPVEYRQAQHDTDAA